MDDETQKINRNKPPFLLMDYLFKNNNIFSVTQMSHIVSRVIKILQTTNHRMKQKQKTLVFVSLKYP